MASGKLICLTLFLVALQPGISYARGFTMPYTVDSSGNVGFRPAITVDRNNKTHIAYYDLTEATIKYATNASGTWKTYTIDDIVGIDTNPSSQINTVVTVDSNNKAYIAYFYQVSISGSEYFRLKYANNRSGSWAIEQVCSENNSRGEASVGMAIDSKDDIYVSSQ